jgi:FkbM family methyltransferase
VLVGAEHRRVLSRDLATVIDIGANRGQFALAVRKWAPAARIISFEPLPGPTSIFRSVFAGDNHVKLYQTAIGPKVEQRAMHLSKRDDSSSLLPISPVQTAAFPGTAEVATFNVPVGPLSEFICADELKPRSMLKLDVQGFEYEALLGCEPLLAHFQWIYCECSFIELYAGQRLASDVIALLADRGFSIDDIHNPIYSDCGRCIQADLLFSQQLSKA